MEIRKGSILNSDRWDEPVVVESVEDLGDYVRILGRKRVSNVIIDEIIPIEEIKNIKIDSIGIDFSADGKRVFLILEAKRYKYLSVYDPLLAVNTSKVDPLPHQIEAVYDKVLKLPRIRFLIADDPGAGKTIMAGLIIKELKIRGLVDRILIVVPGHLKDQWRRELRERFEENFIVIDRNFMNTLFGENPWLREKQIITSISLFKKSTKQDKESYQHSYVIQEKSH